MDDKNRLRHIEKLIDVFLSCCEWQTAEQIGRHFVHKALDDPNRLSQQDVTNALVRMVRRSDAARRVVWRGCYGKAEYKRMTRHDRAT